MPPRARANLCAFLAEMVILDLVEAGDERKIISGT